MSGHVSSVGQVTDTGGGLSGCGNTWRWRNPDVSSIRRNRVIACRVGISIILK